MSVPLKKRADGIITGADWDHLATDFLGEGIDRWSASYVIYTNGTDTWAFNGTTGIIDYGGPNDNGGVDGADVAAVVQAAIDALTSGGAIHFKEGTYTFGSTVDWPTDAGEYTVPIKITGCGWNTILTRSAAVPIFTLDGGTDRCRNIILRDLAFQAGGETGEILRFVRADKMRLENLLFYLTTVDAYAIYAEESWDTIVGGCLFHAGGSSTQSMVYLFNGATNNCNNWRFIASRFERGLAYNSIAIHSDGTGAGSDNHNIGILSCKFHGVVDATFTTGAILFESTHRSTIRGNWIAHHLGNVVDIDSNCELVDVAHNHFLTFPVQGNPTSFVHLDGDDCKVNDIFTEGTPTQIVLVGANANNCAVNYIASETAGVTYVTDNGADTEFSTVKGDFPVSNVGGGAAAVAPVINTSPGGVDIDANDEFCYIHIPLPVEMHQVVRLKLWAYSNVLEADAMRLRIVSHGATDNEAWSGNAVDVPNHPSESSNFAADDVIYWLIDAGDDAQIGTLAAQDLIELMAVGEIAGGADAATDVLFGGWEIEYV